MEVTVISAFYQWVVNGVVAGVVGNFTYDSLKFLSGRLKEKIRGFFSEEKQADVYVESIINTKTTNILKPQRDIEDLYETIASKKMPMEFPDILKEWIVENKNELEAIAKTVNQINIGSQTAGRDIINVQGKVIINNK